MTLRQKLKLRNELREIATTIFLATVLGTITTVVLFATAIIIGALR